MAYTTISKSSDYFNTKLYTGNGGTNAITGVGFQPDWLWLKKRNSSANHFLFDAVRGASKELNSNNNEAEASPANYLSSFNSDGFTIGSDSDINGNSDTFASWNWKANGAGSANTDGATASTVSANTTSGFSIVKYTGTGSQTTIGHGLGITPKMIIVKRLQNAEDFAVYHASNGAGTYQSLNTTEAKQTNANRFNVAPTSSVFTVNTHESVNFAENYIAYCFAEKQGFSKFSSYTGNGNADGTFIYTGFKPAFVMVKDSTSAGYNWLMYDNKRLGYNPDNKYLVANENYAEAGSTSDNAVDLLSNGFKFRTADQNSNRTNTYIYMAFAEAPLVGSNNTPCTAR
tara:strand:- start:48 stop:1079 length:1032 start_codon:yes stop_codon:yes gene_type:complete